MLSLAAQTNAIPLPSVPEVFGVRLPTSHSLTNVDFDLIPNKPPPNIKQYDEEIEEVEEEESDEEDILQQGAASELRDTVMHDVPPHRPFQSPSDADMASPALDETNRAGNAAEGSEVDGEEHDGLFAGVDDDSDGDDGMERVDVPDQPSANGIKRKLVEEDDYD